LAVLPSGITSFKASWETSGHQLCLFS